ncbi:DedA family protein [Candidatus Pacearchaeota archaeon]|nr:DedA family protein [Candidatus Pacearchaeota archaeon]
MDFITLLTNFFELHPYWAYIILFLGSYFETLIGPGFFIYGEIFFLSGSIIAGIGYLNIWLVAFACISGGLLGDHSSYFIGRKYGNNIVSRFFKKNNKYLNPANYEKAKGYLHRRGAKAIFFTRFMGPISWITPFIAGTIHVKYRDFLIYNTLGTIGGIGIFLIVGYTVGSSYALVLSTLWKAGFYIIIAIAAALIVYIIIKKIITKNNKLSPLNL